MKRRRHQDLQKDLPQGDASEKFWTHEERKIFNRGIIRYGKNFPRIVEDLHKEGFSYKKKDDANSHAQKRREKFERWLHPRWVIAQ